MDRIERYKVEYAKLINLVNQDAPKENIDAAREVISDIWDGMSNDEYYECIDWWFVTYCEAKKVINEV